MGDDSLGSMKVLNLNVQKLMAIHFLMSALILILAAAGFSHRSSTIVGIFQIPLFVWPIWFVFLGRGWKRALSVFAACFFSLVMLAEYLFQDENLLDRRRFTTRLGQIYVVQQFDFDHSEEMPDRIDLEEPLALGFVRTINRYFPKSLSIGKISEAKVYDNTLVVKGTSGSYSFKRNRNQLLLVQ